MRGSRAAALLGFAALTLAGCTGRHGTPRGPALAPVPDDLSDGFDRVTVDLRDGTSAAELADFAARHKIALRWESQEPSIVRAALAVATAPIDRQKALLDELRKDPLVERAEHTSLVSIPDVSTFDEGALAGGRDSIPEEEAGKPRAGFPNDGLFDKQWHLAKIHAVEAWKHATGKGVIVGVLDTGVAYENKKGMLLPDLEKTAFVEGWNFIDDTPIAADDHGHGSHCAGTIAQSTDNGRGCAGVAPGARIMPLKVLDRNGSGNTAGIAAAIRYAADHGCKVMNLSLGGGGHSQVLADAVWYAYEKGCVVCCAAGNSGRGRVEYPAAYPGALAVSSVGPSGNLAFYSSYGDQIWVAGPGGDKSRSPEDGVLQNTIDPRGRKSFYGFWQGTSMATPHVAGVAALLVEAGVTNPEAVFEVMAATAKKPGGSPEWDKELGYGVVDAAAAVEQAQAPERLALVGAVGLLGAFALALRKNRELALGLAGLGGLVGACGVPFSASLGLTGVPVLGALAHGLPSWGLGNPILASALVPGFLGLASVPSRRARSFALGLMLGCAAHLVAGGVYGYASIDWVPGNGALDRAWLVANGAALVLGSAMVVRLARGRGVALAPV